uniref:Cytochrome P450 n=1 Tax=Rhodonia placenta TaxID=104341 RepID=F1SY54_9APHY|nr:cytochrome P450 [Postia placenta]
MELSATTVVAVLSALYFLSSVFGLGKRSLRPIPTVGGPSLPLLRLAGSVRFLFKSAQVLQEGYDKFKGKAFKHSEYFGWHVYVSGPRLTEELRRAPEDQLSCSEAINDSLQVEYTLSPGIHHDSYHIRIVRTQLTRNLGALFSQLRDEIVTAFADQVPLKGDGAEWVPVKGMDAVMEIVVRTSNRVFIGLPLCRDADWCALNKQFTIDCFQGAAIISLFPKFLKPIAARFLTNVPKSVRRGQRHLEPIILERFRMMEEHGSDWADKPNDMLQWLMDDARGEARGVRPLVLRLLSVNIAAIHTTSIAFTNALYLLAAHPEFAPLLRAEIEGVVAKEGWTKAAMNDMRRLDSFLKETLRYTGLGAISLTRKALADYTFADGTFIPAGTTVSAPLRATHYDDGIWARAAVFDPWRFSTLREAEGESAKHHMVSTSTEYLAFGHGQHACPGRFFAANEMKAMLAHVLVTYDVKMEQEGVVPPPTWFGPNLVPNWNAKVLFRTRQAS